MKHAVLGAGGVGALIGGALARSGHSVTMIVRPGTAVQYPPELNVHSEVIGQFTAPVDVTEQLNESVDVVWVTVKATQLNEAAAALPPELVADTLVIPLMNGVDHVAWLRSAFPAADVVAGAIVVESERTAPGRVRQLSPFVEMKLSGGGRGTGRVEAVAEQVRETGLTCEVVGDEAFLLWGKLAFLAPLALTTTAMSAPLGDVRAEPAWQRRLETCVIEVCEAARTEGATVDAAATQARLSGAPGPLRSSMQKDVEAGRQPELDAIGGPVVRAGMSHGFDVSCTRELMEMIRARAGGDL